MSSIIMALARTLHAAGELKMLSFLSVCLFVRHASNDKVWENAFAQKELELRSDFDILDSGRLFNFVSVRL